MRPGEKHAALVGVRIEVLEAVRDKLRGVWLALASHRGLESLAEPVEAAVDAVTEALEASREEAAGEGRRRVSRGAS